MCICEDGFVFDNGKCIKEEECGCLLDNGASISNGFEFKDCRFSYKCSGGNITRLELQPDEKKISTYILLFFIEFKKSKEIIQSE